MCVFKWNENASILQKGDQIVLIHGEAFIKIGKEYFDIIDEIIKKQLKLLDLKHYFVDEVDCKKVTEILFQLQKIGVVSDNKRVRDDRKNDKNLDLSFIVTNRCNLSCRHCSQSADRMECSVKELSFDEICKMIDIITKYGIDSINITGGEPMVRSDFLDIVRYLRSKYDGNLVLLTNGLLISEKNVADIISLFDYISISIDGIDEESTSIIRGKGIFAKTVKIIKLLHNNKFNNIELSAILPNSIEVEKKFDQLCEKLSVKPVHRDLIYSGRAYENANGIKLAYEQYIEKYGYSSYDSIANLSVGNLDLCNACKTTISIDAVGNVYPCNLLQKEEFRIGNILENTDLLYDYKNSKVSNMIERAGRMDLEPCKNCDVKKLCWFCLADFYDWKRHPELYRDYCSKRKRNIYKFYFEE